MKEAEETIKKMETVRAGKDEGERSKIKEVWWRRGDSEEEKRWRRRGNRERHKDHMVPPGLRDPSRLSHLTHHTHICTKAGTNSFLFTHTHTLWLFRSCSVYVFMHLVAVPNKAGRLTVHIASNQESGRESDRERERKDLALNGVPRHRLRLKHLAWNRAIIQWLWE